MDKFITITFTGEPGTGKSVFMEALAHLLVKHGVVIHDDNSRTSASRPVHEFKIKSADALAFGLNKQ